MESFIQPKWHVFMVVASLGSLSRAAHELDCPPSLLSRQINGLESQCGHRLFQRTGRGLVLTEQGQLIHQHLSKLIQASQSVQAEIDQAMLEPMGEVWVGLLPTLVHSLAADLFGLLRERFPKIRLHLTDASSPYLEEWLGLGRLHSATLIREDDESHDHEPLLAHLDLHLIGAVASPWAQKKSIKSEDIFDLPLILPAEPHPLRHRLTQMAKQHGRTLNIYTEANSVTLQIELARANAGYAIVAESTTRSHVESGRIFSIPIVKPRLQRRLVVASSPKLASNKATQAVMATLIELKHNIK